jgi:hypothetical protein
MIHSFLFSYPQTIMSYAGKINQADLDQHLIPAYDNFKDLSFDISIAKNIIIQFICSYCKTMRHHDHPSDPHMYNLSICDNYGFILEIIGNKHITFLINALNGAVYVAEHVPNTTVFMASVDFDFLLMMHQNSRASLPTSFISPQS